jgi:hypothetical protein
MKRYLDNRRKGLTSEVLRPSSPLQELHLCLDIARMTAANPRGQIHLAASATIQSSVLKLGNEELVGVGPLVSLHLYCACDYKKWLHGVMSNRMRFTEPQEDFYHQHQDPRT